MQEHMSEGKREAEKNMDGDGANEGCC